MKMKANHNELGKPEYKFELFLMVQIYENESKSQLAHLCSGSRLCCF